LYLFDNYGKANIHIETLIRKFYKKYKHTDEKKRNRVDVSDLTKLLHFIRKGNTPLYNQQYRDFFCLKNIGSMINTPKDADDEEKIEDKIKVFKQQYYFINSVFDEIIKNSKSENIYDFSDYFDSFIDKFYITDKGITKHKMIDYGILYFN